MKEFIYQSEKLIDEMNRASMEGSMAFSFESMGDFIGIGLTEDEMKEPIKPNEISRMHRTESDKSYDL